MTRSAADTLQLIRLLAVDQNFAFQPREGATYCNDYVSVACAGLGVKLPPLKADDQADWLAGVDGVASGWRLVDPLEAQHLAELGTPVVASWKNPSGGHGHIALVVPGVGMSNPDHLYVSAAGSRNYVRAPIENSFGLSIHPLFFANT